MKADPVDQRRHVHRRQRNGLGRRDLRLRRSADTPFGGRWSETEKSSHINVLELRAIIIGIRCLRSCLRGGDIIDLTLYVDNTSAIACATKGRAPQFEQNGRLHNELGVELLPPANIHYVQSARNFADKPSRS